METVLVVAVALFLGFNLGVLVVKLHGRSGGDDTATRIRADVHPASAWWR